VLEFSAALPQGLDTPLGGRGHGLSGGQAQRVALARLFLRDPGLILLDEPTAHLDEATQARVLDEILAFAAGRTLLLATHAPAVAGRLGRILRVAGGKVEDA
jgi:ATP-binding cassette subfamily C protein CydD